MAIIVAIKVRKDGNVYLVPDSAQMPVKSFGDLDIIANSSDSVWGYFRKMQDNPVMTTLEAFSKFTDLMRRVSFLQWGLETNFQLIGGNFCFKSLFFFKSSHVM